VPKFNTYFFKTYHRIPIVARPNIAMDLLYYLETYDGICGIFLKEKYIHNLEKAQVISPKLESNILLAYRFPLIHVLDQPGKVTPFNDIQPSVVMRA
jgi:hypothetical protein